MVGKLPNKVRVLSSEDAAFEKMMLAPSTSEPGKLNTLDKHQTAGNALIYIGSIVGVEAIVQFAKLAAGVDWVSLVPPPYGGWIVLIVGFMAGTGGDLLRRKVSGKVTIATTATPVQPTTPDSDPDDDSGKLTKNGPSPDDVTETTFTGDDFRPMN